MAIQLQRAALPLASTLEARDLVIVSRDTGAVLVDGVSLTLRSGEILALVGESGSGKSLTALALLGLLPPSVERCSGQVLLDGRDVTDLAGDDSALRGRTLAAIFQDPQASLDPRWTVGRYLTGQFVRLRGLNASAARRAALGMLDQVGLGNPERIMKAYPHELSGGMAQRVMMAGALAGEPHILIADEPTTALDVTTQAQILDLLEDVQRRTGLALLLITHDLGIVAETAHRLMVLYGGRVMESGDVTPIFETPLHPYTRALLSSTPDLDADTAPDPIPGSPGERLLGAGCPFQPRCTKALALCRTDTPQTITTSAGRDYACHVAAPPQV